ncbi:hypothetical protein KALB_5217 [Kutzneria albida DSM 43870]|uniref:EVE domain-containing protein n=1 Tax=Kutzneria albida DSM 43870 TaxID=1449976 RepID=W5WK71_9PSEU|nr:hypothetical protein KALB_5217 [Kutzneria albida DSM 43870]
MTSAAYPTTEYDSYWTTRPEQKTAIGIRFDRYLFDAPITRQSLKSHPVLENAVVMRMPGYGAVIPLQPEEWQAICALAEYRGQNTLPGQREPVVSSRPLGAAPAESTTGVRSGPRPITFPEA